MRGEGLGVPSLRTSSPATKLAATSTNVPPTPKPQLSAPPVGAKLLPRSAILRGCGDATSTYLVRGWGRVCGRRVGGYRRSSLGSVVFK